MEFDTYQQFIHKSRYARYIPNKQRREHWTETVNRYMNFMKDHLEETFKYKIPDDLFASLREGIVNHKIMPSMRAMMAAGKALARDNTCGYNCAFIAVDDPKAFDETMHILMCGTGVGFSVERQYINQLPEIPDKLFESDVTITFKDSREGWAKGFRMFLALLYSGEIPKWDLTKLRPAGAVLKTMGGRSSGPQPLDDLLHFTVRMFKNAAGRKLTSLECHDLMCKIADIVVVGGVRRSAMISLSNLSDDRMRNAKHGAWWEQYPHRSLSNNSAVYSEKPDTRVFMSEWLALYDSKSGERGIFSREAAKLVAERNGRRNTDFEFGTNPCSEIILRPSQFCNLTEVICRADDTESTINEKIKLATILGTFQSTLTHFPYLRKIWTRNTEEERLLGVSLTGIYDNPFLSDYTDKKLPKRLESFRNVAIETNKEFAETLGIPQSTAVTCVKPSGTVSQLTDSASGIHPRHAKYYLRRVRQDNKDPLTQVLKDSGIPNEPDVTKPHATTIFTFPKKVHERTKLTRDDVSALDHLNLWLVYQRHWCEHKPSVTITVKEDEWMSVGAWVYDHFDEVSGISFLPYDGGTYKQAPYETITKDQYEKWLTMMPKSIDWDSFVEDYDAVEGTQTLACTAGGCEL